MRLLLPYLILFVGILLSYYYKRFTRNQKKWLQFLIGTLLIIGWCFLIIRMI